MEFHPREFDPPVFHYDFEASSIVKDQIHEETSRAAPSPDLYNSDFYVQKFKTYEEARKAKNILNIDLMIFAPWPVTAFEINGEGYLVLSVRGVPFIPCQDHLFESKVTMYDGKIPKALFITLKYKHILRYLITYVCLQKDYQIRARINLGNVYALYGDKTDYHAAFFTKYHLQECVKKNDHSEVIKELIDLIREINTKCCIEDPCEAEFNVLFDGFAMPETPYEINEILNSLIFWTRAERMEFLKRILKLAKAKEIDICGESIKDSLGTDWGSKLKQMEKLVNASKRPQVEINPDEFVVDVIDRIVYAYDHVAEGSQEFEDAAKVVDYVQYSFPSFFAALAEQSKKLNWSAGKMVEDFLSKRCLEERLSLQTGEPMPDANYCSWDSYDCWDVSDDGWDSDDGEVTSSDEGLECPGLEGYQSIWHGPALVS